MNLIYSRYNKYKNISINSVGVNHHEWREVWDSGLSFAKMRVSLWTSMNPSPPGPIAKRRVGCHRFCMLSHALDKVPKRSAPEMWDKPHDLVWTWPVPLPEDIDWTESDAVTVALVCLLQPSVTWRYLILSVGLSFYRLLQLLAYQFSIRQPPLAGQGHQ